MDPQQHKAVSGALTRYRVMAWIVGVLLVLVGVPLEYIWGYDRVDAVLGVAHGWLYMVLLIAAYDLGRRVAWPWKNLLLIALAGTVPFLSFVAERYATRDVRRHLADQPSSSDETQAPLH